MKSNLYVILLLTLFFTSCKEEEDPKLSTPKQAYTGNVLRVDGYYSLAYNNGEARLLNYILYRDGTVLYGGSPLETEKSSREQQYADGTWYTLSTPEKTYWGVFTIDGSDIMFDQWNLRDGGLLDSYKTYGTIVNDSTFVMTKTDRAGYENVAIDEVYRFTQFDYKPDSVNQFLD